MQHLQENALIYVTALLAISEGIAMLPFVKSNSILQAIINGSRKVKDFLSKK